MNPDHESQIIQLSLDGVMESKSSLNSLDTFSVKFNNCRNIYPIRLIKPCDKYKYDEQLEIKRVLDDLNLNDITIDCAVLDKPKRSTVLCLKGACAKFPCEYCESSAVLYAYNPRARAAIEKRFELSTKTISQQISNLEETLNHQNNNEEINDNEEINN